MSHFLRFPVGLIVALIFGCALTIAVMTAATTVLAVIESEGNYSQFREQLHHYLGRPIWGLAPAERYIVVDAFLWLLGSSLLALMAGSILRRLFPRDGAAGGDRASPAAA